MEIAWFFEVILKRCFHYPSSDETLRIICKPTIVLNDNKNKHRVPVKYLLHYSVIKDKHFISTFLIHAVPNPAHYFQITIVLSSTIRHTQLSMITALREGSAFV